MAVRIRTRRGDRGPRRRQFATVQPEIETLAEKVSEGVAHAADFPHTIVFDWNGTIDARNTGVGIPIEALVALKNLGKNVIVYTSSLGADRKLFMRKVCEQHGIPITDNEAILDSADMFVADKKSDERRAGRHGINFVYTPDFDFVKTIEKGGRQTVQAGSRHHLEGQAQIARLKRVVQNGCPQCRGVMKEGQSDKTDLELGEREAKEEILRLPIDQRIVEEVRRYNHEYGGTSIGDIVYELNSRGIDLRNQGATDRYAHIDQEVIQKMVDDLVSRGRLLKVERPDAKPTYFHVHVG